MKICFPSLEALLIDIPRQSSVLVVVLSRLSHGSLCMALHAELVEVKPPSLTRVDIEPWINKIVLQHDAALYMQAKMHRSVTTCSSEGRPCPLSWLMCQRLAKWSSCMSIPCSGATLTVLLHWWRLGLLEKGNMKGFGGLFFEATCDATAAPGLSHWLTLECPVPLQSPNSRAV